MNSNYFISAFGTFGNPNGFRQSFWFTTDRDFVKSIKTFDLNTNAIKLFPKSKVYSIRKELCGGRNIIAYSIYSYAKEQNSDRSGTFIGSSILFTNKITEEQVTISQLNEFHENLVNKNVQNDIITVNHSDKLSVIKPKDFDKISYQLKSIEDLNYIQTSDKILVVFCETNPEKLQHFLKKAIDLLNVYDSIYFTDSKEVAEFVNQKGIFRLIQNVGEKRDLEQEIQKLQEERKRKIEQSLSDFEKERQKLEDERKKLTEEYKEQIERNEKLHLENKRKIDESKSDLARINQLYSEFSRKINDYINQLKSTKKQDEVKQLYNDTKRHFSDSINQIKKPNYLSNISNTTSKSELREDDHYTNFEHDYRFSRRRDEKREYQLAFFKIATFALFGILIGTLVYILFFHKKEETTYFSDLPTDVEQVDSIQTPTAIPDSNPELNPKPNGILNEKGYRSIAKKINHNTPIDSIVKIIFDNNPTDVGKTYAGQENSYGKKIIDSNQHCFEKMEGIFSFTKDTLKYIPIYKQKN